MSIKKKGTPEKIKVIKESELEKLTREFALFLAKKLKLQKDKK